MVSDLPLIISWQSQDSNTAVSDSEGHAFKHYAADETHSLLLLVVQSQWLSPQSSLLSRGKQCSIICSGWQGSSPGDAIAHVKLLCGDRRDRRDRGGQHHVLQNSHIQGARHHMWACPVELFSTSRSQSDVGGRIWTPSLNRPGMMPVRGWSSDRAA